MNAPSKASVLALTGKYAVAGLPEISDFDREAMKASIERHGIAEPVLLDDAGEVVDGRNRVELWRELGRPDAEVPTVVLRGLSEEELRSVAFAVNVARRHVAVPDKRRLWAEYHKAIEVLLKADPMQSDRSVSDRFGVDHKTVGAIRGRLTASGETPQTVRPHQRTDQNGQQDEDGAENFADHRNETYVELVIGYAAVSDEERTRAGLPYPQASERHRWESGRLFLVAPAPRSDADFNNLLIEAMRRVQREAVERPLRTMLRATAAAR